MCQCSTSTFQDSCERTQRYCMYVASLMYFPVPDIPESVEMTEQMRTLASKAAFTRGLWLERSEVFRSLGHYMRVQSRARTSQHRSPEGDRCSNRKRSAIFLQRTKKGFRQPDQHWNCFNENAGKNSERRSGAHMGLFRARRYYLELK